MKSCKLTSITIVLADSNKSRSTALVEYALWSDIDYLITDIDINPKTANELKKFTKLVYCNI